MVCRVQSVVPHGEEHVWLYLNILSDAFGSDLVASCLLEFSWVFHGLFFRG